ncbi:Kazal-like serine protease inhibitor domain-containing protein [Phytophthora sojae]|uniref:Kazal-like serine protease inhibitor domain-containing protein n=1 Tax=Phytophthora sojae (strain P6497) TaxID=1094619 RepID=G4YWT8_PHYSP|nr:Kazal-like serine protease inhibitor domain-containing protein [Phytophthora sojae]EGZ23808.1 Kazal-like serine protease inhibitor domain-containing protein [Phytophthora sojae]|eukprot:XP_009519096.1 Kazal-like serine protease inhibitor domain-containing protein [Phytophthora sojae]
MGFFPVVSSPPSVFDSICPNLCPAVMDPVSDENGVTYSNRCKMLAAKCKQNGGGGGAPTPAVATAKPSIWDSFCADACLDVRVTYTNEFSIKKCADACPDIMNPVCGSNGIKYSNPCKLKIAACKSPELNIVEDDGSVCKTASSKLSKTFDFSGV